MTVGGAAASASQPGLIELSSNVPLRIAKPAGFGAFAMTVSPPPLTAPATSEYFTSGDSRSFLASYAFFGPMPMRKVARPSMVHSSRSPGTTGPTPAGVPVKIKSLGWSSYCVERLAITSGTFHII